MIFLFSFMIFKWNYNIKFISINLFFVFQIHYQILFQLNKFKSN